MSPSPEECIERFYQSIRAFAPVSREAFLQLRSLIKVRRVRKNEFLLREGQISRNMYFVCRGILTSLYITEAGGTHIKNFFLEGNFAASTVSSLLYTPSAFSIQSLEDSVVLEMDYRNYKLIISQNEELKSFYIRYLEEKWVIENEKKQIAFATQTAAERYQTFLAEYPSLEERVSQLHIASYLGVTPTQLSRIRKNLKK